MRAIWLGQSATARPLLNTKVAGKHLSLALITLLIAALGITALSHILVDSGVLLPYLPSPQDAAGKLFIAPQYAQSRVLYLGNSRVLSGIDAEIVAANCGCGTGFNAAFNSSDPIIDQLMAKRLLETFSLQTIVIGLSHWELSDRATIRTDDMYPDLVPFWDLPSYGSPGGLKGMLRAALGAPWPVVRYRGVIRTILEPAPAERAQGLRRGFFPLPDTSKAASPDPQLVSEAAEFQPDPSGRRSGALQQLLSELHRRNIKVLVLAMPLRPDFYQAVQRHIAPFESALRDITFQNGATFADLSLDNDLQSTAFWDDLHLNSRGAEEFSAQIRPLLAQLG